MMRATTLTAWPGGRPAPRMAWGHNAWVPFALGGALWGAIGGIAWMVLR